MKTGYSYPLPTQYVSPMPETFHDVLTDSRILSPINDVSLVTHINQSASSAAGQDLHILFLSPQIPFIAASARNT